MDLSILNRHCTHEHTTDLNEFDADGTIVTERIQCNKCHKTNAKIYEAIMSQTIWNDNDSCTHHNYQILSYKKLEHDQIRCAVMCRICRKESTNLYNLEKELSVCGWDDFK